MSLEGANDRDKLTSLCKKTYKEQAIWFLNACWDGAGQRDAELFWKYVHKAVELDLQKKKDGSELDELNMHRFLESFKNERTVRELRDELRKVGVDNFKFIPLTMFLIWHYRFDWHKLVHAPQAANGAEIAKASEMLESSQKACDEALRLAEESSHAEKEAKAKASAAAASERDAKSAAAVAASAEAEAKARASEAEAAEADLKKADDELAAALAELKAQEDAFNNKTEDLKKKSEEGSTVQKSKAANELAQHLSSDPLPLRKAKMTTEAAKRKAEKARAPFAEATAKAKAAAAEAESRRHAAEEAAAEAEADRRASEEAAADAEAARQAAEDAVEEAKRQVQEAEDYLEEQKKAGASSGQGTLWWLDRELQEQKKYMPQSKGGVVKK